MRQNTAPSEWKESVSGIVRATRDDLGRVNGATVTTACGFVYTVSQNGLGWPLASCRDGLRVKVLARLSLRATASAAQVWLHILDVITEQDNRGTSSPERDIRSSADEQLDLVAV